MLSKLSFQENITFFSNQSWRTLLSTVCKKIDKENVGLQVISPFGFELLEDKRFLSKPLKRFYCYIGVPRNSRIILSEIASKFSKELMLRINEAEIDQSNIAVLVEQEKFTLFHEENYICSTHDKLIDIQAKYIDDSILHDYARYVMCIVDSICSNKDEAKHFLENKRHRSRTYQLYVMLENIFGYLLPSFTVFQKEKFSMLFKKIDNSIQMFYSPSELYATASLDEVQLLNFLIIPRVTLMKEAIKQGSSEDDFVKIECEAYHVKDKLELNINREIYQKALEKVIRTYENFII